MIVALTANGPGEFAGWLRPLVAALYARAPALDVRIFCVPDDYASGNEPAYVQGYFPRRPSIRAPPTCASRSARRSTACPSASTASTTRAATCCTRPAFTIA